MASADMTWYTARIDAVNADGTYQVPVCFYICCKLTYLCLVTTDVTSPSSYYCACAQVTYTDYGNSENLDIKHLRLNPMLNSQSQTGANAVAQVCVCMCVCVCVQET